MNYDFNKRPNRVQAFQMTEARRFNNSDWPNWLHAAWNMEPDEVGSLSIRPTGGANDLLDLRVSSMASEAIAWDDWIVRYGTGRLAVLTPTQFTELFEEAR